VLFLAAIDKGYCFTRSGTGKSSLLKKILLQSKTTNHQLLVYCVNVGPVELAEYKDDLGSKRVISLSFSQLSTTRPNSTIIFEDIIYLTPANEKTLRQCLNFDAHHKAQKVFCVTHSVQKTAVWSLLPFFHYLIFSNSPSNKPVIRTCLKTVFKMDASIVENWLVQFLALTKTNKESKNCYFYFDTSLMKFYFTSDLLNSITNSRQLSDTSTIPDLSLGRVDALAAQEKEKKELQKTFLESKFDKFTETHLLRAQAAAVFSILINCLNLSLVRDHDLTISFQSNLVRKTKRISLVDYILCLLDSAGNPPSQDLLVLHNYLKTFCNIPSIFVSNPHFKAAPLS
jgi:hypothetical protein